MVMGVITWIRMRLPSDGEPSQRSQSARWSKFNFPHQRSSSWTINYIFGVILHFHKNFWSGWGVRRIAFSLTMIDIKGGEDLDQPVKVGLGVPGAQPPQAAHLPPHPHSHSPFTHSASPSHSFPLPPSSSSNSLLPGPLFPLLFATASQTNNTRFLRSRQMPDVLEIQKTICITHPYLVMSQVHKIWQFFGRVCSVRNRVKLESKPGLA